MARVAHKAQGHDAAGGIPADQSAARHGERQGKRSRDEGRARPTTPSSFRPAARSRTSQACCAFASGVRIRTETATGPSAPSSTSRQSGRNSQLAPAKFQVNVTMAADKFATLLRVANAGRLPTKFFVDAGDAQGTGGEGAGLPAARRGAGEGLGQPRVPHPARHELRDDPADRPAACDHDRTRAAGGRGRPPPRPRPTRKSPSSWTTCSCFRATRETTMFGLVCVLAIVALAALADRLSSAIFFPFEGWNDEPARFRRTRGRHHRRRAGHRLRGRAAPGRERRPVALWDQHEDVLAQRDSARSATPRMASTSTSPSEADVARVAAGNGRGARRHRRAGVLGGHHGPERAAGGLSASTSGSGCSTSTCTASSCAIAPSCRSCSRNDYGRIVNIASVAGKEGNPERLGLQRVEGGGDRAHQVARQGAREHRHPRQLRDAGRSAHRRSSTR